MSIIKCQSHYIVRNTIKSMVLMEENKSGENHNRKLSEGGYIWTRTKIMNTKYFIFGES